ncbi:hypothetical protein [Streptomyces noursei]|uniref:Uncharacterized protein n=1 Tax=Streptomyces noursei TaxID=1971 RepID=A0A2N8PKR4_STRNR|nr:hypothetical protein [Streptomyces noursei]PNE41609.1 hypothetical protein AOB60_13355 [Streptomyces noursei]
MSRKTVSRLVQTVSVVLGVANAVSVGSKLAAYDVPLSLIVACALSCLAMTVWFVDHLVEILGSTMYRCTDPACSFKVRVRYVDAAENRRWQETAAEHPTHLYRG